MATYRMFNDIEVEMTAPRYAILSCAATITSHYWDNPDQDFMDLMRHFPGFTRVTGMSIKFRPRDSGRFRYGTAGAMYEATYEGSGDPTVFLVLNPSIYVVGISGTRTFLDIVNQYFRYDMVQSTELGFSVPRVYKQRAELMKNYLRTAGPDGDQILTASAKDIFFTGHSQGGAMSKIMCKFFKWMAPQLPRGVWAWDPPKVFRYDEEPSDEWCQTILQPGSNLSYFPHYYQTHNDVNRDRQATAFEGGATRYQIPIDPHIYGVNNGGNFIYNLPNNWPVHHRNVSIIRDDPPLINRASPLEILDMNGRRPGVDYSSRPLRLGFYHNAWRLAHQVVSLLLRWPPDRFTYDFIVYLIEFARQRSVANSFASLGENGLANKTYCLTLMDRYVSRALTAHPEWATNPRAGYTNFVPPMPPAP